MLCKVMSMSTLYPIVRWYKNKIDIVNQMCLCIGNVHHGITDHVDCLLLTYSDYKRTGNERARKVS